MGLPQAGFSALPSFVTGDNGITPAFNWDNGFPQNFAHPPNLSPYQLNGFAGTVVLPDWKMQRKLHWSFTVERQFSDDWAISASYVGSKGTHIMDQQLMNQLLPARAGRLSRGTPRQHHIGHRAHRGIQRALSGFRRAVGSPGDRSAGAAPLPAIRRPHRLRLLLRQLELPGLSVQVRQTLQGRVERNIRLHLLEVPHGCAGDGLLCRQAGRVLAREVVREHGHSANPHVQPDVPTAVRTGQTLRQRDHRPGPGAGRRLEAGDGEQLHERRPPGGDDEQHAAVVQPGASSRTWFPAIFGRAWTWARSTRIGTRTCWLRHS